MTVPGSLLFAGALVATSIASLFAAQSANAQEWLQWRGLSSSNGVDPAKVVPAATDRPTSKPIPEERAAPANATRLQAVTAKAESSQAVLAPALSNPSVPIEPLPSPAAVLK